MTSLNAIFLFLTAYLAVFMQAWLDWPHQIFGVTIALLPGLMVYAGLARGLPTVIGLSLCSGLWLDAVSETPLGASILPLFLVGFIILQCRELLLRANPFAHGVLGAAAGLFCPLLTLFIIWSLGASPLIGWRTLWQLLVATAEGAVFTPLWFAMFDKLDLALNYRPKHETSFRSDREIKRGRA